jgi:hydrogenase maturation protein HypF
LLRDAELAAHTVVRRAISVTGIVQGVGFRPFVHALAHGLGLTGFVRNWSGGALIEVEGRAAAIDRFLGDLHTRGPAGARIDGLRAAARPPCGDERFVIESSALGMTGRVAVSPDIATCDDCLAELLDPHDRRYQYPFITCAHCGPRLTIVTDAPYDRDRTTMAAFALCPACRAEYEDANDRRFHAQAIACPACGPRLRLLDGAGAAVECDDVLARTARALRDGAIVAVKGLGGYHLVCDATDARVVAGLRARKARDAKPLAVMVEDVTTAEQLCNVSAAERLALTSPARPIVLLRRRPGAPVAAGVAPDSALLGVMLPYTPLHHLLARQMRARPLVMTSGNRSDEPIAFEDGDAIDRLSGIADLVLAHDRPIHMRCDDSVVRVAAGAALTMRRARGHAPVGVSLRTPLSRPTLALGGHLKAAVALGDGTHAMASHHLGDLDQYEAYRAYVAAIEHYQRLFCIEPRRLVHDLHPDYASSRYAAERARRTGIEVMAVQHHHAHMASAMTEHGLAGPVIGVCFDGAGWGTDGTIWGGEFLLGDDGDVRRAAHLGCVGMPGGEAAVREPWRMAVAHLAHAQHSVGGTPLARRIAPDRLRIVERMIERAVNTPRTSSVGRWFDAVAALAGVCDHVRYEGQAAMMLESLAGGVARDGAYPFELLTSGGPLVVDPRGVVLSIAAEVRAGVTPAVIARRFHSTLVDVVTAVCERLRADSGVNTVVLSGGVFVNAILAGEVSERLARAGFAAYGHHAFPPNDGGLCLGQLAIAAARDGDRGSA